MLTLPYLRFYPLYHLGLRALVRIMAPRMRVTGRHNIPYRGPVIFAPNHISDADPPLVGYAVRWPLHFMAKRELWDIGWLAPLITYLQAFPVDPSSPDRAAMKRAFGLLENRQGLVVFPEGKISHSGELEEILPGAIMLALKSGAPVIPVGLAGAEKLIPYGSTRVHFTLSPVHIHFGAPVQLADLADMPGKVARELATERLCSAIIEARRMARKHAGLPA